ncbi:hypothetical protein SAMN05445756_1049 [Kytococcus aerolatus]|uniref:Small multi-drug export protein n=1 Tax=Kytococcus aerolatus TaxID=592308 RepID=A0A212TDP4_9MICO|nr:hypothetical protein [Kytococcus aerolatus]SNC64133.1 hypothetical protein SAMN05445756_1049 [Kytococcus aerolatus]
MLTELVDPLQSFTEGLPPALQWAGVALIAAIPFVESYFGSTIGVLTGLNPSVAVPAAIVGNVVSMVIIVSLAGKGRDLATGGSTRGEEGGRHARLRRAFNRWGVPGVSLLGQTMLPSQITSAAMVGFGADRRAVILWQCVSITLWGVAFGALAASGVALLG